MSIVVQLVPADDPIKGGPHMSIDDGNVPLVGDYVSYPYTFNIEGPNIYGIVTKRNFKFTRNYIHYVELHVSQEEVTP